MKRKYFLISIFIVLFLIVSLSILHAHGPGREMRKGTVHRMSRERAGREMPGNRINRCLKELDLSAEQSEKLNQYRQDHISNMEKIHTQINDYRVRQRQLIQSNSDENAAGIDALIDEGVELWKQQERERIRFQSQLYDMLTQEQRDKLVTCESLNQKPKSCYGAIEE